MLSTSAPVRGSCARANPLSATGPGHMRCHAPKISLDTLSLPSSRPQTCQLKRPQPRIDRTSGCTWPTTTCGAIVPILGFLPSPFVLACVMWTLGAIRFWRRFDRTSYMRQSRLALTALWPLLFIGSPKFRSEFKKAVSTARDGI